MKTLEERIAALEKANRRWRYGAAILMALAGTIAMMGAQKRGGNSEVTDLLRARRIEVVRENGQPLAVLGPISLKMQLDDTQERDAMPAEGIAIFDKAGRNRVAAMLPSRFVRDDDDGGAALVMLNRHGRPAAMLYDEHGIGGELNIHTSEGKIAVGVSGTGVLTTAGHREKGGAVVVFDGEQNSVACLGRDPHQLPVKPRER